MSEIRDEARFTQPQTVREAKRRKLELERDILNIEHQLSSKERIDKKTGRRLSSGEYKKWAYAARASLVYKKQEFAFLKHWVLERRVEIEANKLGIFDPGDSREVLQHARIAIRRVLNGDQPPESLGAVYNVIDQHLQHLA